MTEKRVRVKRPAGMGSGVGPKRLTLTVLNDAEPVGAYGTGRLSRAEIGKMMTDDVRLDSIRAYRRQVDALISWVRLGRMLPKDALAAAQVIKTGAELLMTENVMAAAGAVDRAPEHPMGLDGGTRLPHEAPEPPQQVEVSREVGRDAKGNPINLERVTITGGAGLAKQVPMLAGPDGLHEAFSDED